MYAMEFLIFAYYKTAYYATLRSSMLKAEEGG